jgi:hypothetical protein
MPPLELETRSMGTLKSFISWSFITSTGTTFFFFSIYLIYIYIILMSRDGAAGS